MKRLGFLIVGSIVGALACGEPAAPADVVAAVPKPKKIADAGVALAPSAVEPYQYTYVAMGKRDPFRNQSLESSPGPNSEARPGIEVCEEPLCQFDLDELKLVAVVSGDANPVAMVEDRAGVGHVVRRNAKMGRQAGKVTSILRDCIVVTSFVKGPDERLQPNRQNLCVSTEGQGTAPILDLMNGKTRE